MHCRGLMGISSLMGCGCLGVHFIPLHMAALSALLGDTAGWTLIWVFHRVDQVLYQFCLICSCQRPKEEANRRQPTQAMNLPHYPPVLHPTLSHVQHSMPILQDETKAARAYSPTIRVTCSQSHFKKLLG